MKTYWTIRSRWDYFAFTALFVWTFGGLGVAAYGASIGFTLLGSGFLATVAFLVFAQAAGVTILAVGLSKLVPLATIYGSARHDHLDPGPAYHLAALVFGPIVGLHYLYRTNADIRFRKHPDLALEVDGWASETD